MKTRRIKQINVYKLDLDKTDQNGRFPCPYCGIKISPDDHSELVYSIMDINLNYDSLEEIVLYCRRCTSLIHLTGFSRFHDLAEPDVPQYRGKRSYAHKHQWKINHQ